MVATQRLFIFNPIPGEMIQFDEHIFQMGWLNHQLDLGDFNFRPISLVKDQLEELIDDFKYLQGGPLRVRFLTSNSTRGVMLFFVKKTDGLLVMDEPAGAPIDVQLMGALDCVPPTVEQLSSMTLNSLGCVPRQFGYSIKNALASGKDSLLRYMLGR